MKNLIEKKVVASNEGLREAAFYSDGKFVGCLMTVDGSSSKGRT